MTTRLLSRQLLVHAWPEIDRRLWQGASDSSYVAKLNPATVAVIAKGYGRWLSVLTEKGCLLADKHPADRLTPAFIRMYIDVLRDAGNTHKTIVGYLDQLGAALRIMEPRRSYAWLHPLKRHIDEDRSPTLAEPDKDPLWSWPEVDQRLWRAGLQPGDILTGPRYVPKLQATTMDAIIAGYRRWLTFLRGASLLDVEAQPAARATLENVIAYVEALGKTHRNTSIVARIADLRAALRIMHPEADFRWLSPSGGFSLSLLQSEPKRPMRVLSSRVLYEWGQTMMQEVLAIAHPEHRRQAYRDGLLIALFAARAPRVRSMASLRLGKTVIKTGKTYRLVFEKEDVKTNRRIEYDAPVELTSAIDHYISVERSELLAGQAHDEFWLDRYGQPLSAARIGNMVQRKSKKRFGFAFGPHRFRHALGTTAPLADPAHPGVAAAILGISGRMVEEHYNRANQADVAHRFHAALREERAGLRALARRAFGQQRTRTASSGARKSAQEGPLP